MNGAYNTNIAPNTILLSGLPKPAKECFFPAINYSTQEIIGLLQIDTNGNIKTYASNVRNLTQGVYEITYISQ